MTKKPSVSKTLRTQALAAGAKADTDFVLFEHLTKLRNQIAELVEQSANGSIPPPRGMLLRYDFFLERGRFFQPQPLPKGIRRGRPKECYFNSLKLALLEDDLTYVEGFVVIPLGEGRMGDVEHGWCVTKGGMVIDVTLKKPGLAYFGVPYTEKERGGFMVSLPRIDEILEKQIESEMKRRKPKPRASKP